MHFEPEILKNHIKKFRFIGALKSYLKYFASTGKIAATIHKNPLTTEIIQYLFEAGELASADTKNPRALQLTTWFYVSEYFGKRGGENQIQASSGGYALIICFPVDRPLGHPREPRENGTVLIFLFFPRGRGVV